MKTVYSSMGGKAEILNEIVSAAVADSGAEQTVARVRQATDLATALATVAAVPASATSTTATPSPSSTARRSVPTSERRGTLGRGHLPVPAGARPDRRAPGRDRRTASRHERRQSRRRAVVLLRPGAPGARWSTTAAGRGTKPRHGWPRRRLRCSLISHPERARPPADSPVSTGTARIVAPPVHASPSNTKTARREASRFERTHADRKHAGVVRRQGLEPRTR